ncbi:MAG TPA: alcohol dehydrogenase catalytic domain-containing protein, partial [Candidatus Nitrosotenuis sp.]|nr:alcohol dehydrogenase catalytic domain-containing protein [Candidatus Nitrosotenuis sp.]
MKTASVKGPAIVEISETAKPTLGAGEVLVKMQSCGICGSDVEKVFGKYGQPSMRLGHEPAGIIVDVG